MSSVTKRVRRQMRASKYPGRAAARRAIAEAEAAFGGEPVGPELAPEPEWVEPPPDPRLDFCPGAELVYYPPEDDTPLPYAVHFKDDIIGAGYTAEEALAEARAQVAEWERNEDYYIDM